MEVNWIIKIYSNDKQEEHILDTKNLSNFVKYLNSFD
jgi:hypothetical protein